MILDFSFLKFIRRVKVSYAPWLHTEALASRKVVWGDPCTEVSGTAKVGTEEHEPDTEAVWVG